MFSHVKDIMSWKVFPSKNRHDNDRANVSEGLGLEIPFLEKIIWTTISLGQLKRLYAKHNHPPQLDEKHLFSTRFDCTQPKLSWAWSRPMITAITAIKMIRTTPQL